MKPATSDSSSRLSSRLRIGKNFFCNVFATHPSWTIEVKDDDFDDFDCDTVVRCQLRGFLMHPIVLHLAEVSGDSDDPSYVDLPSDEIVRVHMIPTVVTPDVGAFVIGWGTTTDLSSVCDRLDHWGALLSRRLVECCGWNPEEIPLQEVVVLTHLEWDDVSIPSHWDCHHVIGRSELSHLPHQLASLGSTPPAQDPRRSLRLVADLLDIAQFTDENQLCEADQTALPRWMVAGLRE